MTVHIVPIGMASVRTVWPLAAPHLAKALVHARGCYELEDLLDITENGKAQLWMCQRDDGHVVAALVSWFGIYPRRKSICVPFIGGTEMRTWFRKALLAIESWGIEQGCDALEGGARRGWARMAKMDESAVVLWKDIGASAQEQKAA